jgi:hypothetical protein
VCDLGEMGQEGDRMIGIPYPSSQTSKFNFLLHQQTSHEMYVHQIPVQTVKTLVAIIRENLKGREIQMVSIAGADFEHVSLNLKTTSINHLNEIKVRKSECCDALIT